MFNTLADKGYFPKSNLATKYDQSVSLFASNKSLFIINGSWSMVDIRKQNPSADFGLMYLPLPDGPGKGILALGALLGIDTRSKHPKEAKAFLNYVSQPEIASMIGNKTGQIMLMKNVTTSNSDLKMVEQLSHNIANPPNLNIQGNWNDVFIKMITLVVSGQSVEEATKAGLSILDASLIP